MSVEDVTFEESAERAQQLFLRTCSGCMRRIPDDHEVYALRVRTTPPGLYDDFAGAVVAFTLTREGRKVPAIVPAPESGARRDGVDLLFQVCSPECGDRVGRALEAEQIFVDSFQP